MTETSSVGGASGAKSTSEARGPAESKSLSAADKKDVASAVSRVDNKAVATEAAALTRDVDTFHAAAPTEDRATRATKDAPADPAKVADPAAVTPAAAADPAVTPAAAADPAVTPAAAADPAVTPAAADIDKVHDDLLARAEEGAWRTDPAAARTLAGDLNRAAATLPADQQEGFLQSAGAPLGAFAREAAAVGTVDATKAEVLGAIAPALRGVEAQAAIDGLARGLRAESPADSAAAFGALSEVALSHPQAHVQTSAARTALAGPVENLRSALSGTMPGQTPENVAELARTAQSWDHAERVLGVGEQLGPQTAARLTEAGLVHTPRPETGPLLSPGAHAALDGAGLIPLVGEVADLVHAGIYALEGDGANAMISLGSMIPAGGQVLAGGRLAGRGVDALEAARTTRYADDALNVSPALRGSPYHPDVVAGRVRPEYRANPAHDPQSALFNPRKTPEPTDAATLYQDSTRAGFGTWYARGDQGWYRYFADNAGGVHFSGIVRESEVPSFILRGQ